MKKIVLATGNQGKVREMADLLADFGFDVVAQSEFNVSEVADLTESLLRLEVLRYLNFLDSSSPQPGHH